ncbi:PREDICTED: uncharacterized protein LOC104827481 isoform X1 [Tarenaya hassleriana]|uniref:uncharacterized protein LOC104827481 isoform X2 n=1 Tax=Tarenaya hassleriana TaxID=28532 RepID=UPI00053C435A|nr:PREDICTED: uncharacterized protein LOC104827481 isoform X2 [Tarenaya hassleriana]XP_010558955.1 PREDICTED: uncharacterized protein LOC104827481 isoform X1 [Tarenaya hassleriana]
MRSLAACYSEHAIKVSDSYCSGPSNHSYLSPTLPPSIPESVTTTYKSYLPSSDKNISFSLTWSENLAVVISSSPNSKSYSVILRKPKGYKKLTPFDALNIEITWDLSRAKYENGPEPIGGFSVTVTVNSETALQIGDQEESLRHDSRTTTSPSWRVSRTERFAGICWISTKAQFSDTGNPHEILIQCGGYGGPGAGRGGDEGYFWKLKSPETMSVCVDQRRVFHVKKLRWNFRGNQTIFLDGLLIDMMWDLHDWFFRETTSFQSGSWKTTSSSSSSTSSSSSPACAVFMFRTRSGFDSRLWLEEEEEEKRKKMNTNNNYYNKNGFSLLICAC